MTALHQQPDDRFRSTEDRDAAAAELFERLDQTNEPEEQRDLRAAIAMTYVDLAGSLARRYCGRGEPFEDLRQAAYVGLMKAIRGYTLDRGSPFVGYAVPTITGELKRHFRDYCWAIRPSRRVQELQSELGAVTEALAQELGHEPSARELTARLEDDRAVVDQARSVHSCYTPRSLDAPVDTEESTSLHAVIGAFEPGYERAETHVALAGLIRELPERDRELLGLRFYEDLTQREIAERSGVTQMQISRRLSKIFARLRAGLAEQDAGTPDRTVAQRNGQDGVVAQCVRNANDGRSSHALPTPTRLPLRRASPMPRSRRGDQSASGATSGRG